MKNWIHPWMWGNTECCCEDDEYREDGDDGDDEYDGEDDPTHHVGLGGGGGLLGVPDGLHLGDVLAVLGGGVRFQI